jgi:hypothetical protein
MFKKKKQEPTILPQEETQTQELNVGKTPIQPEQPKEMTLEEAIWHNGETWYKAQVLQALALIHEELRTIRELNETEPK